MHDFLNFKNHEFQNIKFNGPFIPSTKVKDGEITIVFPNSHQKYNEADQKNIEKNYKPKKLLVCGTCDEEYNHIFTCALAR